MTKKNMQHIQTSWKTKTDSPITIVSVIYSIQFDFEWLNHTNSNAPTIKQVLCSILTLSLTSLSQTIYFQNHQVIGCPNLLGP